MYLCAYIWEFKKLITVTKLPPTAMLALLKPTNDNILYTLFCPLLSIFFVMFLGFISMHEVFMGEWHDPVFMVKRPPGLSYGEQMLCVIHLPFHPSTTCHLSIHPYGSSDLWKYLHIFIQPSFKILLTVLPLWQNYWLMKYIYTFYLFC